MQIKLVIWDLDETLWSGTLADHGTIALNEVRADMVRKLNERGVVSSICSKNDPDQAEAKLKEFGLWDQFVFPQIAFAPKGAAIAALIEDMQLRPVNVLFVDDNKLNLEEARAFTPELNILDASDPGADALLAGIVEANEHVRKSRLDQYKSLERKQRDLKAAEGSREEFLYSCEIRLASPDKLDNTPYVERIAELINRSNQMNYTKSRVDAGELAQDITVRGQFPDEYYTVSIFAWDNYGYYGLVGFAAVEDKKVLRHFVFSCRIMHMGVEGRVLKSLLDAYPELDVSGVPVVAEASDWIHWLEWFEPSVRDFVARHETGNSMAEKHVRIMAHCQTGMFAHFAGLGRKAHLDSWPRVFSLQYFATGIVPPGLLERPVDAEALAFPRLVVYAASVDYSDSFWSDQFTAVGMETHFTRFAEKFAHFIAATGRRLLVILPPVEEASFQRVLPIGITEARARTLNRVWMDLAVRHTAIDILRIGQGETEIDIQAEPGEIVDFQHFEASLNRKISQRIRAWVEAREAEPEAAGWHEAGHAAIADGSITILRNIAPGKACAQSSHDPRENPLYPDEKPERAVDPLHSGDLAFATDLDKMPWWGIDLGEITRIGAVALYNFDRYDEV